MLNIKNILSKIEFVYDDIYNLLSAESENDVKLIQKNAYNTMKEHCGEKVYLRGLIEFSNVCINDCYYCGIRKSNRNLNRYTLSKVEILESAKWCAAKGFGSIVLQSGERNDEKFIEFVAGIVEEIKEKTKSEKISDGLGITLCIGEQNYNSYKKLFEAGAHRYLLRIETSNEKLFYSLHPEQQNFKRRLECLQMLKEIGYQTGTGVMIGLPNQTIEHLAEDILFFKKMDIDMIGMGPYLVHRDTPLAHLKDEYQKLADRNYLLSLKMIAVTRLFLKDVNIAATTALQAMKPYGREEGLSFGANVFMPLITPAKYRKDYMLYDGKPCIDDLAEECIECSFARINSIGREIGYDEWGDSKHFNQLSIVNG
ncbi:MAG: [FeFe] hydrogenase H-cluster radical SAM maturase HydE [bacterium]